MKTLNCKKKTKKKKTDMPRRKYEFVDSVLREKEINVEKLEAPRSEILHACSSRFRRKRKTYLLAGRL